MCDKLKKRAKRKFLGRPTIEHLIALDSPLKNRYMTSLYCSSTINVNEGKIHSRYCKRAWCSVCAPIRTAVRINNYSHQLADLGELDLTTLTIPNVPASEIRPTIQKFRQVFRQFRNTLKKRGETFRGIYNFEVTFNPKTGLFHPHIHILHESKQKFVKTDQQKGKNFDVEQYTNSLIHYWCNANPQVSIKAQDTRPCFDIIEAFKYQSLSIFKIKVKGKKELIIPVRELDAIYQAIAGIRCFQPFGINKIPEVEEEKQMDELEAFETDKPDGVYRWTFNDWLHISRNDISLSGFIPDIKTYNYYETLSLNQFYDT